ncbi:rhodanese-like domain-containing protein [Paenibacillus senegalensis]|uniref:rhodanese-like domain-containing protein n=1 Tax=Paenibacillus senegalensis TaxID=1465766 RepID=UPI00028850D0|nr:rhodanese-like domain-containing protein [Paenibacillus senegalensis]
MPEIIEGVSHLNADEVYEVLNQSPANVYVIDVREPEEYEAGHIPGIPLLPMGQIPEHVDSFDKDAEYIFICRSGRRSLEVARFFQSEGIEKVHNYLGGMLAWDKEIAHGNEHVITEFSMANLKRKDQN